MRFGRDNGFLQISTAVVVDRERAAEVEVRFEDEDGKHSGGDGDEGKRKGG